jgi:long-chain acyl-CoA synthetase
MSFNLATILTETALAAPDSPACRISGTKTSYRELDELSGRVAAGLRSAGLAPGEVVALQLPNIPQFLIAYFGALKAGLVVLPLNPLLMAPELEYHLTDSAAALLIGFQGLHAEAAKACETTGVPLYLVSAGEGALPEGARPVTELISTAPLDEPGGDVVACGPDDTAVLVYTSGTTGKPKGAELTHFQLYMNCTVAGGLFGAQERRRGAGRAAVLPRVRAVVGDERVRQVRRHPVRSRPTHEDRKAGGDCRSLTPPRGKAGSPRSREPGSRARGP